MHTGSRTCKEVKVRGPMPLFQESPRRITQKSLMVPNIHEAIRTDVGRFIQKRFPCASFLYPPSYFLVHQASLVRIRRNPMGSPQKGWLRNQNLHPTIKGKVRCQPQIPSAKAIHSKMNSRLLLCLLTITFLSLCQTSSRFPNCQDSLADV